MTELSKSKKFQTLKRRRVNSQTALGNRFLRTWEVIVKIYEPITLVALV